MTILQWAIPSGGIGAAIAWIANRNVKKAKAAKDVHDTYKAMYEDISQLLLETQQKNERINEQLEKINTENAGIRRALNRLSRAIEAVDVCPHRADCPVRDELQFSADSTDSRQPRKRARVVKRQHSGGAKDPDSPAGPAGHGASDA